MWKKIGSIGPASNDNKSSRSRDETAYEPFSQMSKIRVSDVQFMDESTQLFCPNFLSKKKGLEGKYFSQSKLNSGQDFQQLKSMNEMPEDMKGSLIKKKALNRNQMEQIKLRISQKIIDSIDDSLDKEQKTTEQQNLLQTDSTQVIGSQTSLDQAVQKKLKHVKSTPQFNFTPINNISEEVLFDRKMEAQKNVKALRKEHGEIRKMIKNEVQGFKKFFDKAEKEMKVRIGEVVEKKRMDQQKKQMERSEAFSKKNNQEKEKLLNFSQVIGEKTKNFTDKFSQLNQKKAQMMKRLVLLRER